MAVPNDVVTGQLITAADFNAVLAELRAARIDGGWQVLASSVGDYGIKYRIKGGYVTVRVDGSYTTTSGTTHTLSTANLPAEARPDNSSRSGGYFGGHPGTVTVTAAGAVEAIQQSGANRGSVAAILVYPTA